MSVNATVELLGFRVAADRQGENNGTEANLRLLPYDHRETNIAMPSTKAI